MHEIKYSFDNDGIHSERSPIYHLVSTICFLQGTRLCMLNGIPVPPYAIPTLEKSAEFIMKILKPDFSTPMIGDADRNKLLTRRSDEDTIYEGMNLSFDPGDLNETRAFFKTLAGITDREDFLWLATGRASGHEPKKRNFALKESGIYTMRTGWSASDSYMMVHGVQLERGETSAHYHNDVGHLELSIKGEDILLDGGRYIYRIANYKDWREYFVSAKAHNTLYVDNHTMGEVPGTPRHRGVRVYCHNFKECVSYQLIDISHNGYAFMEDPIFHRRKVIRLPGDIFIINDEITGLGLSKHDFRLYFNFAPGDLSQTSSNSWKYCTNSGKAYNFTSIINDKIRAVCLKGSEDPKGGWISYGYPVKIPAPQLYLQAEGPVPLRFITVISPEDVFIDGKADLDSAEVYASGPVDIRIELKKEDIFIQTREKGSNRK
jgi:hypothetical protein